MPDDAQTIDCLRRANARLVRCFIDAINEGREQALDLGEQPL
jgi:hypothetical protein